MNSRMEVNVKGKLYIIGIGPGNEDNMTVRAQKSIRACDVLVGYSAYIEQIKALCDGKKVLSNGMGQEKDRCRAAIEEASKGTTVGLVCSGDPGLYGMAGLTYQLASQMGAYELIELEVIPGVTSAFSCSSLLGAPIVEDFCTISLSDYMVEWDKIINRVEMASKADFTIALYNPRSSVRPDYLQQAVSVVVKYRSEDTPVGVVRNAYREDQTVYVTTLGKLDYDSIDMFCTLIIGNSTTRIIDGYMVTSRGYAL